MYPALKLVSHSAALTAIVQNYGDNEIICSTKFKWLIISARCTHSDSTYYISIAHFVVVTYYDGPWEQLNHCHADDRINVIVMCRTNLRFSVENGEPA